ncbi:hypothetical protein NJB1728e24_15010, partial [Mycobacterium marinum]
RRCGQRGVRSRRKHPGLRQRRRHGATMGRHRSSAARSVGATSDWPPRNRMEHRVRAGRTHPDHRKPRRHHPVVEPQYCAARSGTYRPRAQCGVQP